MHFLNNQYAMLDAIKQGVYMWGNGVERLIRDQRRGVLPEFSLVPRISCDNMDDISNPPHWKEGDILFE